MLRSLLSSPPPAVVAGATSHHRADSVRARELFVDSGGRNFGSDNTTDWTGMEPINAFRPAAPNINDLSPDYFTFYKQDAVRVEDGEPDSKFPYKNGTVSTLAGNYTTPYAFATALRSAIMATCGSLISRGAGTPTYDLAASSGVEVFAWDENTAVGIGGPNPNASIGLNTILTGCVRLAFENMTAVAEDSEVTGSGGKGSIWSTENIILVTAAFAVFLGVAYLCAREKTGGVKEKFGSCFIALKTCFEKRPVFEYDRNEDDDFKKNSRLTVGGPGDGDLDLADFLKKQRDGKDHGVDAHDRASIVVHKGPPTVPPPRGEVIPVTPPAGDDIPEAPPLHVPGEEDVVDA